jgi:hypothetical protein
VVVGVQPPQGVESAPGSRMLSEGFIGVEGEAAKVVVVRRNTRESIVKRREAKSFIDMTMIPFIGEK